MTTTGPGARARVHASLLAQYENLGDLVLRREALDLLADGAPVDLLVADDTPGWWVDVVAAPAGPRSLGDGRTWSRRLLRARRGDVLVYAAGAFPLARRQAPREVVQLALAVLLRLRGVRVVRLPRSVRGEYSRLTGAVYRLACRVAGPARWRDRRSLALVGAGRLVPDLALRRGPTWEDGVPRPLLVVSMRGDRPEESGEALLALVRRLATARDLTPVVVSQVQFDDAAALSLAERLGAKVLTWEPADAEAGEKRLGDLYAQASIVVSNRLHVIMLAASRGALPVCPDPGPNPKVVGACEAAGITAWSAADADRLALEPTDPDILRDRLRQELGTAAERLATEFDDVPSCRDAGRGLRRSVVVLQPAMGAYRQGFLEAIEGGADRIRFLVGDEHFNPGVVTGVDSPHCLDTGRNVYFAGRRLGFQRRVSRAILTAGVLVIDANPRNLSSWTALAVRHVLRRPTLGWGHVHTRGARGGVNAAVRRFMQRRMSGHICYTDTEREAFARLHPRTPAFLAANALYPREQMRYQQGEDRQGAVLIGRLVADKKPVLAVEAFAHAVGDPAFRGHLHVVGVGPLEADVRGAVARHGLEDRVTLHGQVTDRDRLAELFAEARVLLASGYVGLNVTQSLGFGVPVVYPDDEPHAPEIEALDATNSRAFTAGDPAACAATLREVFASDDLLPHEDIARRAREKYSTEAMATPFHELSARLS